VKAGECEVSSLNIDRLFFSLLSAALATLQGKSKNENGEAGDET